MIKELMFGVLVSYVINFVQEGLLLKVKLTKMKHMIKY